MIGLGARIVRSSKYNKLLASGTNWSALFCQHKNQTHTNRRPRITLRETLSKWQRLGTGRISKGHPFFALCPSVSKETHNFVRDSNFVQSTEEKGSVTWIKGLSKVKGPPCNQNFQLEIPNHKKEGARQHQDPQHPRTGEEQEWQSTKYSIGAIWCAPTYGR